MLQALIFCCLVFLYLLARCAVIVAVQSLTSGNKPQRKTSKNVVTNFAALQFQLSSSAVKVLGT